MKQAWQVKNAPKSTSLNDYPPLIRRLLTGRGILDETEARAFLSDSPGPRPDPWLLPDISRAVERIEYALSRGEAIVVYGDYDVDGLTSAAILFDGLEALGGHARTYIPNRFDEGYGLNKAALLKLRNEGADLLITADCGTTATVELEFARSIGLDVIVLDHHEATCELPPASIIVNPKRAESRYPTPDLCSGALALRLVEALFDVLRQPLVLSRYVELAALATVCDMVPLLGENRELVKAGLIALANSERPGIRALLRLSKGGRGPVNADTLAFRIGPRLNAAGRLGDARLALETLISTDVQRAAVLAHRLDDLNRQRQQMVESAAALALAIAEPQATNADVIVVGDARISRGIVGLVATRLVEYYQKPAFVYEIGEEECVGSVRGVPAFDVVAALGDAAPLLTRFGGHRAAGGFTVPRRNLEALYAQLQRRAGMHFTGPAADPGVVGDAEVPLRDIDGPTLGYLRRFAPCGVANPEPLLISRDVVVSQRRLTTDEKHLQLQFRDGPVTWRAIAFKWKGQTPSLGAKLDILYSIETGLEPFGPQLRIADLVPSTT